MKTLKTRFSILLKRLLLLSVFLGLSTAFVGAQNNSHFVSIAVPSQVVVGETFQTVITFMNTGTTAWTSSGANPYRLGTENDPWNLWATIRVDLSSTPIIQGQSVTFTFNCVAPSTPGNYNFKWRMVQELIEWFGESSANKVITVVPQQNNAQFISLTAPSSVVAGQTFQAKVIFKNNGTKPWVTGGSNPHRLGTLNDPWNLWATIRDELQSSPINPGENATFNFECIAPSTPGIYNFQWRMVQELIEWFGEHTENKVITVTAPTLVNNASFVRMSAPSKVDPGQDFTVFMTFKNTGTSTWISGGSTPFKLGSQNPENNLIWGIHRVNLPKSPVEPGESVTFYFTVKAPTTSGTYNFQWKMVQETVNWFGTASTNKVIKVNTTPLPCQ